MHFTVSREKTKTRGSFKQLRDTADVAATCAPIKRATSDVLMPHCEAASLSHIAARVCDGSSEPHCAGFDGGTGGVKQLSTKFDGALRITSAVALPESRLLVKFQ